MPDYLSSYYPYYIPYYSPYYTPYYTPYTSSYQGYTPVTLGYTAPTQGYTAPAQGYTVMTASNSSVGVYLTDGRGITLYHLLSDQGRYTSNCTDATCTRIWPPFYAAGINVPANLNPADFSTITVNGYKQYQQITYKGWPLYYFYRDTRPGDIYGQGIRDSYGVWSVVSPESPNTFPVNYPYPSSGAAAAQYQYPTQQPSTITLSPSLPAYTTPSLYPPMPAPRPVTAPVSGSVPVTIRYPGAGPFDVYLDGNYVGTGSGGSFSFSAPAGYHDVRVWDGSFDYEQSVLFESGVSKIIYVEAV
jgi:predicted lipoprotein with Yx(FWY)xxD motif